MASSPPMFFSDFESSSGSDMLPVSSRASATRNPEFLSTPDMGLSAHPSARDYGGFFPSPNINPSHSQSAFQNSPVRTPVSLPLVSYIAQQYSMPNNPSSFSQTNPYNHAAPRISNPFEELSRMRGERDHWRTKYYELK